jgi:hypothetical protein
VTICLRHPFHGGDEAIADLGQSLNKLRRLGGVLESLPQFLHGSVDAMLEVNEGVLRPECGAHLFPGNDLPFGLQEEAQNLKRLILNGDTYAGAKKFAAA